MNTEHKPIHTLNRFPVASEKTGRRRLSGTIVSSTLLMAVLGGILLAGCCKLIPFTKCKPNELLSIQYRTDTDSNNGRTVQVRFLLFENRAAFERCSPRVVFKSEENQASYDGLEVPEGCLPFDIYLSPDDSGSIPWTVPSDKLLGEAPLYLGIIANFAQPASGGSGRAVVALEKRKIPRAINVRVGRDYLQIVTGK